MIRTVLTVCILLATACLPARGSTTDWSEVHGGAVRLISSGPLDEGRYLAGLEFLLEPGWHTYWRYPGEAGIPPLVTVLDSQNLKDLEILYPAPERYNDGYSESIVYHHGIVLPIRITPKNPDQDVQLNVEVLFGICKDICVPGDANLSLQFSPAAKPDKLSSKLIARDLKTVPQAAGEGGPQVTSVVRSGDHLEVVADIAGAASPDLFAEAPEGSYIGLPKLVDQTGDQAIWHLSTKGLAITEDDRTLRLVLTTDKAPIEHLQQIDPTWLK